ncbi:hypothetical protein HCH44_15020 [Sphingomonas melonis]|jgi:hypothetical protein|nr:hypothetical protein [Sphingomonas melonis]MBX8846222.1 hypothetical protein [Sphingomonas melonis]MBX8855384.1 hypothetical protein [Sphingomonas melonis]MBX8900293.1 hypothetical protein [Sphingomonas melonis]
MINPETITPAEVAAIMEAAVAAYWTRKRETQLRSDRAKAAWRRRKGIEA